MEEKNKERQSYAFTPESNEIQYQAIPDLLRDTIRKCPDREAVVFLTTTGERSSITFQELYDSATYFAKGLIEMGIKKNDVVALSNKNCVEWVICAYGIQMAKATPLLFFFKRQDGTDIMETLHSIPHCTAIISDPGNNDNNIDICKSFIKVDSSSCGSCSSDVLMDLRHFLLLRPSQNGSRYLTVHDIVEMGKSSSQNLPILSPDDNAAIFLSSGSTGIPKAVPITHLTLLRTGLDFGTYLEIEAGANYYNDRPFSWLGGYPITTVVHQITRVTASDIMALKSIEEINEFTAKALEAEKCTSALIITPCLHDMLHIKIPPCKQWPLKVIATGGLPVESSCTKAAGTISNKVVVVYGATEVGVISFIAVSSPEEFEDYSVGCPATGVELKIVDDDGNIVPRGTSGEIYFRSRDRFQGYLNNEERSATCCEKTGWYKTDDIGVMRENGNFILTGRKSDMMIIGGLLVTPLYIENIIKRHPRVVDAYIFPVHDDKMFQCAYAAVVVEPRGSLKEEDLKKYIIEQQAGNQESFLETRYLPKRFLFFKEFPHTHNGKLDRKATGLLIRRASAALPTE